MKLYQILREDVSMEDSNKAVYNLVLAHLKTDKNTMSDIKRKMFETDEFFVDELDHVNKALRNGGVDQAIENIFVAADAIGDSIKDHYHNAWNHEPGYKKPSSLEFDSDNISYEEALESVKKLSPEMYQQHVEDQKAARKLASEKQKELIKSLQPLLPALARTIIHSYDKAWNEFHKWLKDNPNDYGAKNFVADRDLDLSTIKTGKELADAIKHSGKEWMEDTYEVLVDGDALDEIDRQTLMSVKYHKNTAKKLWAMVSSKL